MRKRCSSGFGCWQKVRELTGLANDPCGSGIGPSPSSSQLHGFKKYVGRQLVSKQRQFRIRDNHAYLNLISASKASIGAHITEVVAQGHHKTSTKSMPIDGANGGYRQRNDSAHERHKFMTKSGPIPSSMFAFRSSPL